MCPPLVRPAGCARAISVTHSAASQTVAQMSKSGLVTLEPGADARQRIVHLTARAESLLPTTIEAKWAATEAAAGRVTSDDYVVGSGIPQLGNFEAGLVAALTSPAISAVSGRLAAILGALVLRLAVPSFARYDASSRPSVPPGTRHHIIEGRPHGVVGCPHDLASLARWTVSERQ
jgi:DNA-binding MarR family transcriptional regulator